LKYKYSPKTFLIKERGEHNGKEWVLLVPSPVGCPIGLTEDIMKYYVERNEDEYY
jgi:hypothetical protein